MKAEVIAALGSFVLLAAVFIPLERLFPARRPEPLKRRLLSVDTLFFFGQYFVWTSLAVGALALLEPWLAGLLPAAVRSGFRAQHPALQIVEAVFLADLGVYAFHRACHRFDVLWRFHAVHHSAGTVDWLAAHREHPLDGLFTHVVLNVPLLVLGVPLSWLAGLVAFRGLWAIFVHSNVKLPLGPLLYLFGAPQLHRWHHSREGMAKHNFANLAPYMDLLFGTFHRPAGDETWEVGLDEPESPSYATHLMKPFGAALRPLAVGAVVLFIACGGPGMTVDDAGTRDAGTHDAGTQDSGTPDAGPGDAGTRDAGPRYSLSGLPDCGVVTDGGTAQDFYEAILQNQGCSATGCHGAVGFFHYHFVDAGEFHDMMVNQPAAETTAMPRVTPGDINASYLVYKLWGQHLDAGFIGAGERMPLGGPYLVTRDLCSVINWINGGARR